MSSIESEQMEKRIKDLFERVGDSKKQFASGSFWHNKGDNRVKGLFLIECKTLKEKQKQRTIMKEWYEKIKEESYGSGEYPIVIFDFGDGFDIVSLQANYFLDIIERMIDAEKELKQYGDNSEIRELSYKLIKCREHIDILENEVYNKDKQIKLLETQIANQERELRMCKEDCEEYNRYIEKLENKIK